MIEAKTLKQSITIKGKGLHSGKDVVMHFHPSDKNLVFKKNNSILPIHVENVIDTTLNTTIGNQDFCIHTIEHFMFALYHLGITHMCIEVEQGNELPVLDGCSHTFISYFLKAGLQILPIEIKPIIINKTYKVEHEDSSLMIEPAPNFSINFQMDFPHPQLSKKNIELNYDFDTFNTKIAHARTFGFYEDIKKIQMKGYGLGGSLENTLIFTEDSTLNKMKFEDEALYHKILDLCGDLYLMGRPIIGKATANKSGHLLDIQLVKQILQDY